MLNQSTIETILLAVGLMCSQLFYDEAIKPKLYVVQQSNHHYPDSLYVLNKGNYFCPSYCQISHIHLTHESSYNCGDAICQHHKFDELVSRVKIKKDKKSRPLAVGGIVAYDMETTNK